MTPTKGNDSSPSINQGENAKAGAPRKWCVAAIIVAVVATGAACCILTAETRLVRVELALVALLLVLAGCALCCVDTPACGRRGLGLPRGSIRSMLALLIVGSTINFLLFGENVAGERFDQVAAALSTLSGSVIGFYFGGRTAAPPQEKCSAASGEKSS